MPCRRSVLLRLRSASPGVADRSPADRRRRLPYGTDPASSSFELRVASGPPHAQKDTFRGILHQGRAKSPHFRQIAGISLITARRKNKNRGADNTDPSPETG